MNQAIKKNVSEIRRLLLERKESVQAIIRFLTLKGIDPLIAEEIALDLSSDGNNVNSLPEKLMQRIRVASDLDFERQHQLIFVGPTGVGKTTTLMKVANHYLKQGKKVAVTSLDTDKKVYLEEWARNRRIPFQQDAGGEADLLLVDTEGCNFYQPDRVEALGEKIAEWGGEIVLLLSAGAHEVDLYGAVHQFSVLNPSSLAFTKLDETLAAGVLVNVCVRTELKIRYIAFGYPLPGDLQIADPKLIAHKILADFNKEEFQVLRHLVNR